MEPALTRIDSLLSAQTETVSTSNQLGNAPLSTLSASTSTEEKLSARNDSHLHATLHVQKIRTQLSFHRSIRTFHCSNPLMSSNTCLCQNLCPVPSRLYPPCDLNNAGLPIRLDLNIFVRTQESENHLHAVLICLRTHLSRTGCRHLCKSP